MKLPLPRRSLRLKLILASVIVEVLVFTALVANGMRLIENKLLEQAQLRIVELTPVLNAALVGPLAELDYGTLQGILDDTRRENSINYLVLYSNHGPMLASSGWDMRNQLPPLDTEIEPENPESESRFDTQMDIKLNGQKYGVLRFGMSTEFLALANAQLLRQSVMIGAAGIALSIALLTGLGYWLTRHLGRLTQASERVTAGDFSITLPIESQDEIGGLTSAFNLMAEVIRKRIDELQHAEEEHRVLLVQTQQEQARLASLLSAMNVGIFFESADNRVIYANPAFRRIWSIDDSVELTGERTQVLRNSVESLVEADNFSRYLLYDNNTNVVSEARDINMTDGRVLTQLAYPVCDKERHIIGRLWIYEDVTHERQTAERLIYLAERDSLTGLYNRHRFQEALSQMLAEAQRRELRGALLFFDLDGFKYINDTHGHRAGDAVLVRVASTVSTLVRRHEIFSRLGGDEFAVLAPNASEEDASRLAERIVQAISEIPFHYGGHPLQLTASLGLALYPQHGDDAEELISHADVAMYQAKDAGKNAWRIYRQELSSSSEMLSRKSWGDRISNALENKLLRLHFQGIYQAGNGALSHLEVLVRMQDQSDSTQMIMPSLFIGAAEKSKKVLQIDRWVLHESIALLAQSPQIPPLAVNISAVSFDDPLLSQFITRTLAEFGVESHRLLIELTETSVVSDLHDAQNFIEAMKKTGCRTCLDHFGTGFSSFASLRVLNADILKIDGRFIRNLCNDQDNQVFVKSIVDVASGMHKTTVAEFVEDDESLEMLKTFGVDMVQGYRLDKPCGEHPALLIAAHQAEVKFSSASNAVI